MKTYPAVASDPWTKGDQNRHIMNAGATNSFWGLTGLRLVVRSVFVVHEAQKLFQVGLARVAGMFGSLHVPLPLVSAVVVMLLEFFVGIAPLLGVFTR